MKTTSICSMLLFFALAAPAVGAAETPNIVIILADDKYSPLNRTTPIFRNIAYFIAEMAKDRIDFNCGRFRTIQWN